MTKTELKVVIGILLAIAIPGYFNMQQAQVLARDIQRKNDLKHVATALSAYRKDHSTYPESREGKIVACGHDFFNPCEWGKDPIMNYINPMPEDPYSPHRGIEYLYFSNTRDFQLFAYLERTDDAEFMSGVLKRNLQCGIKICNFGVTSSTDIKPQDELGSIADLKDEPQVTEENSESDLEGNPSASPLPNVE